MDRQERIERAVIELDGNAENATGGHSLATNLLAERDGEYFWAERSKKPLLEVTGSNYICTYPEFMEARARLENKPEVWPEDAEILVYSPYRNGWRFGSFASAYPEKESGQWVGIGEGEWFLDDEAQGRHFGDWRESLERRPESKPDQETATTRDDNRSPSTNNEHHDHKEGEGVKWEPPKLGDFVEFVDGDEAKDATVILAVYEKDDSCTYRHGADPRKIQPRGTRARTKWIAAAEHAIENKTGTPAPSSLLELIYDAGLAGDPQ